MKKQKTLKFYHAIKSIFGGYGLGKFYPVKFLEKLLLRKLKSNFAIVHGHKMELDPVDSLSLSINGIYEEFETELIKKNVKSGDIVLDIGAHIGYYTLIFAKLVGENGKVYAFEPDPTNFNILRKNIENNNYKNVVLINKAAVNKTSKLKLYLNDSNQGDHRIYDSFDGRKFVEIEGIVLDEYFTNRDRKINFIKMDIQGAEFGALQGMQNLLKNNEHIIFISEYWPLGMHRFGANHKEYLELLQKNNFVLNELNQEQKKLIPIDMAQFTKNYTVEKKNFTNLFCKK
jgi:FkbM family methyltransferase